MMVSLYLAMMAVGMGQTVVFAIIPMLGRELKLDELVFQIPVLNISLAPREMAITSLSALAALVFFFAAPIWGRLSDRWGRKPVILIGLCGYALGSCSFNVAAYLGLSGVVSGVALYFLLVLSRGFHAGLMAGTQPGSAAYMVDATSVAERTRGLGKIQAFNQLGVMLGPVMAWFVSISFLAPLFVQAGLALLVAALVWRYLPALPPSQPRQLRKRRMAYFDPRYRLYIFVGFALFTLMAMVQQTLGFYFQDTLHLDSVRSAQWFSAAMVVSSAAMLVAQFVIVQRFRGLPGKLLLAGMPFSFMGYLALANADALHGLLLGMALFGFGMGLTGPALSASASLAVDADEQGELAGMLGSVGGLGFVSGPLMGGYLYQLSPSYPYWLAAGIMAAVMAVIWRHQFRAR